MRRLCSLYVDEQGDDGGEARVEDEEKAKEWMEVMEGLWVCRFCGAQSASAAIAEGLRGEEKQTSRIVHVGKCAHLADSRMNIEYRKILFPPCSERGMEVVIQVATSHAHAPSGKHRGNITRWENIRRSEKEKLSDPDLHLELNIYQSLDPNAFLETSRSN
jgi:hypothetical protein